MFVYFFLFYSCHDNKCFLLKYLFVVEWDFGGFPPWLLAIKPALKLRSSDHVYLGLVCSPILLFAQNCVS